MVHHVQQEGFLEAVLMAILLIWQMLLMFGMTSMCMQIMWLKNQKRARFTSTFLILAQQRLMSLNPPLPPLSTTLTTAKRFKLLWNVALEIIHLFVVSNLYLFVIIYSSYIGPAYRIFVRDDDGWSVQGRYETIMKRPPTAEDFVEWTADENDKKFIRVLGVSYIFGLWLFFFSGFLLILCN
jgi:hypothetical protein